MKNSLLTTQISFGLSLYLELAGVIILVAFLGTVLASFFRLLSKVDDEFVSVCFRIISIGILVYFSFSIFFNKILAFARILWTGVQ